MFGPPCPWHCTDRSVSSDGDPTEHAGSTRNIIKNMPAIIAAPMKSSIISFITILASSVC